VTDSGGAAGANPSAGSQAGGHAGEPPAVFISYASADRAVAEALTAYLERHGVHCWIAPRDVPPGALYADAIVRAINDAAALLLLLSHHSIESSHVGKELERASSKRKRIIAVRLDTAPLTPGFEYFLSESQWVDVPADGREAAFGKLASALHHPAAALTAPAVPRAPAPAPPRRRGWPVALGVLALAVLALAGAWLLHTGRTAAPAAASVPSDKSIAVLPFADMSEAHDQEYFADGMSEQILDLLAKIPALKVIARTSSFQFKGKAEDVRVVGEKLGVATVLEGSVRKAGERLRITAQLIRASDGTHLWSEVYDRQVRDVFRTQDEIADAVVAALKVSLLGAAPARPPPTANTEAYALYLQGLAYDQRYTAAESAKARELYHRALTLDPNFALAWAALAGAEGDVLVLGNGQEDSFDTIRGNMAKAANRAIELDPKLADAHVALANIGFLDYDVANSEREIKTALELEPDNPNALGISVYLAISSCRLDDAERFARRLIERDPLSIDPYRGLATALWFDGRAAEAEAVYRRLFAFQPHADSMHARLSLILLSTGRVQDALIELDEETSPGWQAVGRTMAFDALGRHAEADKLLSRVQNEYSGFQYQVAQIYAHRHDREHALVWLERARKDHDPGYINYLKCDPLLSELRSDPRYQAMLSQLNLPP
jgi:serine/threonine-protein kinase